MELDRDKLLEKISALEAIVDQLSIENRDIKEKLFYLTNNELLTKGYEGESLVAKMLKGTVTNHQCSHDVILSNNLKMEVKFSKLTIAVRSRKRRLFRVGPS